MESQHACELCGKILSDDTLLLEHTRTQHLADDEEKGQCPFCGITSTSTDLLVHVNQQHLDFLTPTSQNGTSTDGLHFIDDQQTPR